MLAQDLPTEVCLQIFRFLDKSDLKYTCFYICKKWSTLAMEVYYEEVVLYVFTVYRFRTMSKEDQERHFKSLKRRKRLTIFSDHQARSFVSSYTRKMDYDGLESIDGFNPFIEERNKDPPTYEGQDYTSLQHKNLQLS